MSRTPVFIKYLHADFDPEHYPLEPWHREVIQAIHDKLELRDEPWAYQATVHGRVFWYKDPKRREDAFSRLGNEHLQFLSNLTGFRWIESSYQGRGFAIGLEHKMPRDHERRLRVADSADTDCLKLLEALRRGDLVAVETSLDSLAFRYHYASSAPSWRGFHNLAHCFRALLTEHLLNPQRSPDFPNLTAIEDAASCDPNVHTLPEKANDNAEDSHTS